MFVKSFEINWRYSIFYPFLKCYFFFSLIVMFILLSLLPEEPQKNFVVGLKLKREFKQVYEDLENPETKTLVRDIEKNVGALV